MVDVIASNRTPVDYTKKEYSAPQPGGLVKALVDSLPPQAYWIGTAMGKYDHLHVDENGIKDEDFNGKRIRLKKLFFDKKTLQNYYQKASNEWLWFLMHQNKERLDKKSEPYPEPNFDAEAWQSYKTVNSRFANAIIRNPGNKRKIWIHDYHLTLTPYYVQRLSKMTGRTYQVGQFIHIPFPNYNVIKDLLKDQEKNRAIKEALVGLTSNDFLAFHVEEYKDNFIEMAERMLGYKAEKDFLVKKGYQGENPTFVKSVPISIDPLEVLKETTLNKRSDFRVNNKSLYQIVNQQKAKGRKVVTLAGRLDPTKGFYESLDIIEKLSEKREDIFYIMGASPSRQEINSYQNLMDVVEKKVNSINKKLKKERGYKPILLIKKSIENHNLLCLLRDSDIVFIPSLSDGMNLVAKEAIIAKQNLPRDKRGFIALGYNCGVSQELYGFNQEDGLVRINPFLTQEASQTIDDMIEHNAKVNNRLIRHIKKNNSKKWFAVIDDCFNEISERKQVLAK